MTRVVIHKNSSKTSKKKMDFRCWDFYVHLKGPYLGFHGRVGFPLLEKKKKAKNRCHNNNSQPKKKEADKSFPNLNHLTEKKTPDIDAFGLLLGR